MEDPSLPTTNIPVSNHTASPVLKQCAAYLGLAFGITWLVWISATRLGARPGVGEEFMAFGSAGPAMAAIFLSRSGNKVRTVGLTVRLLWFGLLWVPCWVIYVVSDRMRGVTPTLSLRFGLVIALLAAIPAWIGSGAFSSDSGVRDLLRTLTIPRNWRWQAVAFFSFPAILLIPTAILHAFSVPVVWQRGNITLSSLTVLAVFMFLRNLFFTAFFEEPGWRGFLFSGGIGRDLMYFVEVRVVFLIPITIIMTWIYNRSGGNILSTAIFHAGMNTFPFVLPYAPPVLGLIFVWAAYAIVADKMWRRRLNANESLPPTTPGLRPLGT